MSLISGIALLLIGIFAGAYGTIVGAGGGFIFVPVLLLIFHVEPIIAAGSGLVIVLINSMIGSIGYAKDNKINFKVALTIGLSAIPGSIIGIFLLRIYSSQLFYILFSFILLLMGIMIFKNSFQKPTRTNKQRKNIKLNDNYLLVFGFILGVLSSYLGIGGGWLLVPILIYLFNYPTHIATATSIMSLSIYTLSGVIMQFYFGNIDWEIVLFGGIGVSIGANLGVMISKKVSSLFIMKMLSLILIILGIKMIFSI